MSLISKRYENDGKTVIRLNPIQQKEVEQYKKDILDGYYQLEKWNCDCGCKFDDLIVIAEKDRYGFENYLRICPKCGLVMTNPRMNQISFNSFYDSNYRKLYRGAEFPDRSLFEARYNRGLKQVEYISDIMGSSFDEIESMLEIGCGDGGIVAAFKDSGIPFCKGIDLGSEYIEFGKTLGVCLENVSSKELARKEKEKYDLIVLSHVFEHFLDIYEEMSSISTLLSSKGYLYIEVPGVRNLRPYDEDFLKSVQNAHVRYFTRTTLKNTLVRCGFEEVAGDEIIRSIYRKKESNEEICLYNDYDNVMNFLCSTEDDYSKSLETKYIKKCANEAILDKWMEIKRNAEIYPCI